MRDKSLESYRSLKDRLNKESAPVKDIDYPLIDEYGTKVLINTSHPLDIDIEQITNCLIEDTDSKVYHSEDFVGVNRWCDVVNGKADLGILHILKDKKEILLMRKLPVFAEKYPTTFEAIHNILEDYIDGQFDD